MQNEIGKQQEIETRADELLRGAGPDPDHIRGRKTAQEATKAVLWMRLGVAFVACLILAVYGDFAVLKMLWGAAAVVDNATTPSFDLATPVIFWNAAISVGCVIAVFSYFVFMGRHKLFGKEGE